MKKRIGLLILTFSLCFSTSTVKAEESKEFIGLNKYVNLILSEVKGNGNEESISSLEDSLEEVIKNIKPEDATKIFTFLEEKIKDGSWESEKGIEEAIQEAEKKFEVSLTKEQKGLVYSVVKKIKNVGIDPQFLINQTKKIYEKYSDELTSQTNEIGKKLVSEAQDKIKEEINKSITNYFSDMVTNVKSFIKGIFKK